MSVFFKVLQAGVGPVQPLFLVVQCEAVGPHQAAVHDVRPEVTAQRCTFDFRIGPPVGPVHVTVEEQQPLKLCLIT